MPSSEECERISQQNIRDLGGATGGVPEEGEGETNTLPVQLVDAVHLYFDAEAAELLPLVAR